MNRFSSCFFLLFFLFLLSCLPGFSQAKEPMTSNKVVKIAYVDQSRLRQEYKALGVSQQKASQAWQQSQAAFKQAQAQQEQSIKSGLLQDSLSGGKRQKALQKKAQADRLALKQEFDQRWKTTRHQHLQELGAHEKQIDQATGVVVAEGGFTQLMPMDKQEDLKRGRDVTDLILKKLN